MYGHRAAPGFDWSLFAPTRLKVMAAAGLMLAVAAMVAGLQFAAVENYLLPAGSVLGGDYLAFDKAGEAAREGKAAEIYEANAFEARLLEFDAPRERYGLTWQYPPTYFFLTLPLAFLAYTPGYILWTGATAGAFFWALRGVGFRGLFLFVILASPVTFQAVITGQNGFLTAALLIVAALYPDKRPIAAGLAAALLTVKPQLGLLLPVAYLAGGCWRAFVVAAAGTALLAAASIGAFGIETWTAFFASLGDVSDNLAAAQMPLYKMATPFAAARLAGLPAEAAGLCHIVMALVAASLVALVWRRVKDADLRAAALCAGVFFAAPYAYHYELVILALPAAIVARRGLGEGWLKYERAGLAALFFLPLTLPGDAKALGLSFGFLVVALLAAIVLRRIAHARPALFKFGSAASPVRSD
ncbi:MAG: glycosyltransferase family 87 protein [Amphiplicatus sp.]